MVIVKWLLYFAGLFVVLVGIPLCLLLSLQGIACREEPIAGPLTAVAVVVYSYWLAPDYKRLMAVCGFLIGAAGSYWFLNAEWYPQCHALAYQQTRLSLQLTLTTGLVTQLLLHWWHNKNRRLLR